MNVGTISVALTANAQAFQQGLAAAQASMKKFSSEVSAIAGQVATASAAMAAPLVAMGAKGVLVGRAYLYGLMAGGQAGVERSLEIFRDEILNTMKLLGVASLAELNPDFAKFHLPLHQDHSHN